MLIHWYYPYSYKGDSPTVMKGASRHHDEVVVQALASRHGHELPMSGPFETIRDLREANDRKRSPRAVFRVPQRAGLYASRAIARHRLVASRAFDVSCQYHLNHLVDSFALQALPKSTARVSFVHDVVPHEPALNFGIEKRLLSRTYASAGDLIVFHQVLGARLADEFTVPPERIHAVPIPIDLSPIEEIAADWTDRPLQLLFFGRLRTNKGIEVLCDAVETLGMREDFQLLVAGSGDQQLGERVRRLADRFPHVTAEIDFIPYGRAQRLIRDADLLILPYTTFASQSGVLRDAYGNGRPLLVSDVGALGPTVQADRTGTVVPAGQVDALASAIDIAARQPEVVREWTKNVMRVRTRHDPIAVGRRVRAVFDTAAARSAGG